MGEYCILVAATTCHASHWLGDLHLLADSHGLHKGWPIVRLLHRNSGGIGLVLRELGSRWCHLAQGASRIGRAVNVLTSMAFCACIVCDLAMCQGLKWGLGLRLMQRLGVMVETTKFPVGIQRGCFDTSQSGRRIGDEVEVEMLGPAVIAHQPRSCSPSC